MGTTQERILLEVLSVYCDQFFHLKFIGSNQGDSESVSGVITEYGLRRIKGTAIPICDRQAAADIL